MSKLMRGLLLFVVAVGLTGVVSREFSPEAPENETPAPRTQPKRVTRFSLAGVVPGMRPEEVESLLGKRRKESDRRWLYEDGDTILDVTFLHDRVYSVQCVGPYALARDGNEISAHGRTRAEIKKLLGPPTSEDKTRLFYERLPGTLVFHLNKDKVREIRLQNDIEFP
jgi:hypothetical protein